MEYILLGSCFLSMDSMENKTSESAGSEPTRFSRGSNNITSLDSASLKPSVTKCLTQSERASLKSSDKTCQKGRKQKKKTSTASTDVSATGGDKNNSRGTDTVVASSCTNLPNDPSANRPINISDNSVGSTNERLDRLEGLIEGLINSFYVHDDEASPETADTEITSEQTDDETGDIIKNSVSATAHSVQQDKNNDSGASSLHSNSNLGFASRFANQDEVGEALPEELAASVNYLMSSKLEDTQMNETFEKYPRPPNATHLRVPKVNPLIWENVSTKSKTLDLKLQRCQRPLVKGLTAVLGAFDSANLTEQQQDAVALLSNAVFELNNTRKDLLKPELNQRYAHLCKVVTPTSEWLFGDDLHKRVREMDEEQKTVGVMRHPKPKYMPRFNPMRATGWNTTNKFQRAGWVSRPKFQNTKPQNPFLGLPKGGRQKPHYSQHTSWNKQTNKTPVDNRSSRRM